MYKTYYEILGIRSDATEKEIKQAYRKLARSLHPDKTKKGENRDEKEKIFADVSEAYNILKDKVKRDEYDQKIKLDKDKSYTERDMVVSEKQIKVEVKGISKERDMIAKKAYLKGMQVMKTGDFNSAITFFQAAIENDDSEAAYFYRLAMANMKAKKSFTKAVEYCNEALKKDPYNMEYKLLLGEIYEKAGGISKAVKIYEDILRWDKTYSRARESLIRLGHSPDQEGSKSFFRKILKKIRGG